MTYNKNLKVNAKFAVINDDDDERVSNFAENDERIESFNEQKNKTYEQGHNDHSDATYEENKKDRTGLKIPKTSEATTMNPRSKRDITTAKTTVKLPLSVNHTKNIPPAKDQKGLMKLQLTIQMLQGNIF